MKKKNDPPKDETPTEKMIREQREKGKINQPLMKEKEPEKELTNRQKARRKMVDRANRNYFNNRGKGHGGVLRQHD
jgi:hypothetical protein